MAKRTDYAQAQDDILSRLDVFEEFSALGVEIVGTPRNGKVACKAFGRDDSSPSAVVFDTGRYFDSGTGESLSLFDFAVRHGKGFSDWREARKFYADKAGVKLAGGKEKENPLDKLELNEWDDGAERLCRIWGVKHKRGLSLEAVKLAGGKPGYFARSFDKKSGEWKRRNDANRIVAMPAYGEKLLAGDPVAWVIWRMDGQPISIYRGKDAPPDLVKMYSAGPTAETLMNRSALSRLAVEGTDAAANLPPIELAWILAGPTDMAAVLSAQLAEGGGIHERHLVFATAGGESSNVHASQAALFAGLKVIVCYDRDHAGEIGAAKWLTALAGVASEVRKANLPWAVTEKHGRDSRDFLLGEAIEEAA